MSLEAARNLSVLELLQVLNENLDLEFARVREICLSPAIPAAPLQTEIKGLEAGAHDVLKLIPSLQHLLRPVNRLPPEIISRIAQCLLDEDSIDTRWIIPLTHVCRYWRTSIVSTPGNWTLVSSERIGLAKLSLERRGSAALKLWLDMRRIGGNPVFSALFMPYIRNADSLSIDFISSTRELVQALLNFPKPMPKLRSLSLFGYASGADPYGLAAPNFAHLLTHLSLTGIHLYPSSFLRLRTLTDLTLRNHQFILHLDTLLGFLEENLLLERATLEIRFTHPSLRIPRVHRAASMNRLRYLSIRGSDAMDLKALISNIALQRGVHLEIACYNKDAGLKDVLPADPTAQLPNLLSPTSMEYQSYNRSIRLFGPNGSFSFENPLNLDDPFVEFPLLPLADIQELHLRHRRTREDLGPPDLLVFLPSFFPALRTFAVDCETDVSYLFSVLLPSPFSPPLKTLAFLNCDLTDGFMKKLERFASKSRGVTSVPLHRVVIVNSEGNLPSVASIDGLGKHVPVVHAQVGKKLPTDLT